MGFPDVSITQRTIADALLPTLRAELEHLNKLEIIRRPRESDVRATCGKGSVIPTTLCVVPNHPIRYLHDLHLLQQLDVQAMRA